MISSTSLGVPPQPSCFSADQITDAPVAVARNRQVRRGEIASRDHMPRIPCGRYHDGNARSGAARASARLGNS